MVQLARIGDLVQTKRLLLSIAAEPDTRVHLCVDPLLAGLAALLYPFAEIHTLPAHSMGAADPAAVFSRSRGTLAALRDAGFSAVYLLNFSPLSFALASLFPPEICHGFARKNGQNLYGAWPRMGLALIRSRAASPMNLVDFWAHFHPSPVAPEAVNPIPRAKGGQGEGRIGIVMAGRESRRSLPPEQLAECIQAVFQARGGPSLVCIGSKSERPLVRRLARLLPPQTARRIEDTTGSTTLTDLPNLISGLDMVLTPDTGAMHLAAHLGVPVQAFFLSSAWCFETGPYGFGHKIWQAVAPCSPCLESAPCPRGVICLSPFSHKGFLAHLAGRYDAEWPDGMLGMISMLDSLGVTYRCVDGEDPHHAERHTLRTALEEHLHLPGERFIPPETADALYTEADWMLPGNW